MTLLKKNIKKGNNLPTKLTILQFIYISVSEESMARSFHKLLTTRFKSFYLFSVLSHRTSNNSSGNNELKMNQQQQPQDFERFEHQAKLYISSTINI